jgi:hypothetical protein
VEVFGFDMLRRNARWRCLRPRNLAKHFLQSAFDRVGEVSRLLLWTTSRRKSVIKVGSNRNCVTHVGVVEWRE